MGNVSSEVIIVGGGIIGMLTARELHKAGVDVLVIERGPLGGESSWAGGGIISPLYPWRYSKSVNRLAEVAVILLVAFASSFWLLRRRRRLSRRPSGNGL